MTTTAAITSTCPICQGTGHDDAFGGTCGVCMGAGHTLPRTWGRKVDGITGTTYSLPTGGQGTGTARQARPQRTNAYSAPCIKCGARVAAEAGLLVRNGDSCAAEHRPGECTPAADNGAQLAGSHAEQRRNRFAGPCDLCGGHVPAEAGLLVKTDGRYQPRHDGPCPARRLAALTPAQTDGPADVQAILANVPGGRYALPCPTGSNDLDFWVVTVNQGRVNPARKGQKWVNRFLGGQGKVDTPRSVVVAAARRLAALTPAEREAAAMRFGQEVGSCGRCGRDLTDERSRKLGLGPTCEGKSW